MENGYGINKMVYRMLNLDSVMLKSGSFYLMRSPCTSSKSCLSCCFVAFFANSAFHAAQLLLPFVTSAYDIGGFIISSTQTQDSERLFDTPDSTPDHQHLLDALCPANNVDNTPRVDTPQAPLAPTPVITSPDRAIVQQNVAAELFVSNPKRKRHKESARNSGVVKAIKKHAFADPTKSLLWFL